MAGIYTPSVTVTDANGAHVAASAGTITVTAPLGASASALPIAGDAPLAVDFSGNASGGVPPYTFMWTFGDGAAAAGQNLVHSYAAAGTYTATLTITDASSHTATATVTVVVSPRLVPAASATPTSGDAPLTVAFSAGVTGGKTPFTYAWTFGDGSGSTLEKPSHTYTSAGAYTATLTVTDANGVSATATSLTITVQPALAVTASATPTSGDLPLAVAFTGSPTGGTLPYTFDWTFGDGGTSAGQSPSHTYTAAGNYTASLNVTDSDGHSAAASTTITVRPPPAATASASVSAGEAPVTVNFTGSASAGTVPYSYAWTFGDGGTASSQNPSHAYTSAGIFNARLTVSDATGRTAIADVPAITVSPALSTTAGVSSRLGTIPFAVDFSSTPAGGLQPYKFSWTFGDGGTATTQGPTHTYTAAGTYTPEVTVTDANGAKAVASAGSITVTGPLAALASALPPAGDASLNVTFWGSADGGIAPYGYSWTFGDGATAAVQNSAHTYSAAGTYTATLTVTDASGSTATATATVVVSPALVAAASATTAAGVAPLVVAFTGDAAGGKGPFAFSWTFGDGSSSTSQNPSHTYATAGTYTATLTVTDAYLTAAVASAPTITVSPGPLVASAVATRAAGASPLVTTLAGSATGGVPPYSYSWDFGDGGSSTLATPTHAYTGAGAYTTTLTVNDSNGQSSQATVHLTVYPTLGITTTESPSSGQAPLRVAFSATASGGRPPFAYSWDFGDGARATGATATHSYGAGAFGPSLRVSDAAGDVWSGLVGTVYSTGHPAPSPAPTEGPPSTSPTPSPTPSPGGPSAEPSASPPSSTSGGDSNSQGQGGAGGDRNTYIVLVLVTGSALLSGLGGALYLGWRRRRLL